MQPVLQYVGERAIEELTLHVYYKNGTAHSVHYDDGGEGYAYEDGQKTLRRFTVTGSETELVVAQSIEGEYRTSYATYRVVLHGLPVDPAAIVVDGAAAQAAEATLETGLVLPSVVVGVGFAELRVALASAPPAPKAVAPASPIA
jgi:alpha-glucosidase